MASVEISPTRFYGVDLVVHNDPTMEYYEQFKFTSDDGKTELFYDLSELRELVLNQDKLF